MSDPQNNAFSSLNPNEQMASFTVNKWVHSDTIASQNNLNKHIMYQ